MVNVGGGFFSTYRELAAVGALLKPISVVKHIWFG